MSILNTKNNQEKTNETGAKKSNTRAILAAALATLTVLSGTIAAVGLNKSHQVAKKDIMPCAAFHCDISEGLSYIDSQTSANHIIDHLNEYEFVSNVEYSESETKYMAPAGYTIVSIVERTYTKEDGTKVRECEEPLKTLVDGEYVYSAPNGGTIKQMGKKEYKDSNGEVHTDYVELQQVLTPPTITFNWNFPDTGNALKCVYSYSTFENEWFEVSEELVQSKELTKTK